MSKKSSLFQFTQTQLDGYIKDENSCVKRVPSKMHIGFPPYGLENFKETLLSIISKKKIGSYDDESRGIVLDVRNIKLEGTMSHIRYDSPELHMDIFANFYVFQPHLGALLKGTVKHISKRHVSALIYNVFNVSIRLNGDFMRKLQVNKEISFRVKKFDLQNVLPYIEGELVVSGKDDENGADSGIGDGDRKKPGKSADAKPNKKNSFADTADSSSDDDSEDEKAFKSLVVKTESMTKATAASSSSEGESESSEEEEEKPVVPAPILVKKESSAVHTTSSSDESSDDEEAPPPIPKPLPEVKTEKSTPNKKKNGGKKSSSDSSESESEEETSVAYKFPPSQFHAAKPAIKQESSSDDSDSSSDEEQFKIPLPIVKQEGGQVVVKREMTPSRQDGKKDSSSSSSQSESDTKKPEKVKRKILQATTEKSPPKKSKSSDKESEDINASKSKKTKKLTEKQKKLVKTPKTTPAVVVASRPAASSSSDSSSDSEDDESAINLNNTIQNMAQQILANKSNPTRPTAAAKAPKSLFGKKKSSGPETSDTEPAEKKKKPSKKAKIAEGELSCFGADVLSSTRLDSASPMAKPKLKKIKK